LTPEQARTHPDTHILTRALGFGTELQPDCTTLTLSQEDRLLLCTDGLTKMLSDEEIGAILRSYSTSSQACDALVEAALLRGGVDNVTVLVCASTPPPHETGRANRH
jgi:protein phosphatase